MNRKAIAAAEQASAGLENIQAFLVMSNGTIVSENYYGDTTANSLLHLRSITKSIVSALVGIAIERGIIDSVDDHVVRYIPELRAQDDDERKNQITIRHLLTMTSGFRWEETAEWFFSHHLAAVKDAWPRPLAANPGETGNYDSASADLLSVILTRAAQQDARAFLIDHLFTPLEISDFAWEKDPAGYYRGSAGIQMRPCDLARIGQLYLEEGRWGGRQIVSKEWISQSLAPHYKVNEITSYGYLWRSRQIGSLRYHFGMGFGGQYLLIVPDLNLVVVTNQQWLVSNEQAEQQKIAFVSRVFEPLVKAWQSS
jgi:CubicO group peptidase (beta-lactamase class C family)